MSSRDLNTFMAWYLKGERDHPTIDTCDERGDTLGVRNWQIPAHHGEHRGCRQPLTQRRATASVSVILGTHDKAVIWVVIFNR